MLGKFGDVVFKKFVAREIPCSVVSKRSEAIEFQIPIVVFKPQSMYPSTASQWGVLQGIETCVYHARRISPSLEIKP